MNKETFEEKYIKHSGITHETYHRTQVTLPCNCKHVYCEGWAAVTNNELAIKAHKELYM